MLAARTDAASEKEFCPRLGPDKLNHCIISNCVSTSSSFFKIINNSGLWCAANCYDVETECHLDNPNRGTINIYKWPNGTDTELFIKCSSIIEIGLKRLKCTHALLESGTSHLAEMFTLKGLLTHRIHKNILKNNNCTLFCLFTEFY